jgi:hypothetical protein
MSLDIRNCSDIDTCTSSFKFRPGLCRRRWVDYITWSHLSYWRDCLIHRQELFKGNEVRYAMSHSRLNVFDDVIALWAVVQWIVFNVYYVQFSYFLVLMSQFFWGEVNELISLQVRVLISKSKAYILFRGLVSVSSTPRTFFIVQCLFSPSAIVRKFWWWSHP